MRIRDVLDRTGGAATTLHLGRALRAADLGGLQAMALTVSTGTLDGMLASIQVGDTGTRVAYRDEVVGCRS